MKRLLGVGAALLLVAGVANATLLKFNVTQGNILDQEAGFTDIGSGTSTIGDFSITVGSRIVPGQSVWYNPNTIAYEGYGLESQSGDFFAITGIAPITQASINISWYENNAQYVVWTPGSGPTFEASQPWWWTEDGGVSVTWGADNKSFKVTSNAALFVNGGIITYTGSGTGTGTGTGGGAVPEPGTVLLLGGSLVGLVGGAVRRFARK